MLTRFNKILIGVLALQLVLAIIVLLRGGEASVIKEEAVLAGFDAATVTRVQLFENAEKPKVVLAKRNADWVLESHFDYPAESKKVTDMLAPFAKMTAGEPIATTATRHKQLKVGDTDFERKVVITANGKDIVVFIGASAGLRRNAVRIGDDERVLAASGVSAASINTQPRDWVKSNYYETPRTEITKVIVQRGTSSIEVERVEVLPSPPAGSAGSGSAGSASAGSAAPPPAPWKVVIDGAPLVFAPGESFEQGAVDTVFSDISTINASPADPKRDVSQPNATISVHRKGGVDVFDMINSDEYYWIKQRGNATATLVDKERLKSVVEVDRKSLVAAAPAPAPAPKPGAGSGSAAPVVPKPPKP